MILVKKFKLFAGLIALVNLQIGSAQTPASIDGADRLDAYLIAAFSGSENSRSALFHIGIQGQTTEDGFLVTAVLERFPAFDAGINRGDLILAVDGDEFFPTSSFKDSDNSFELTYLRNGIEHTTTVLPIYENLYDSYRTATISSRQEFSAGNKVIGYLRLWALSRNTADLSTFHQLMSSLDHCDGLILDLRGSFGFFDDAHADALLPNKNNLNHFEKSIVIIFNESTSDGAIEIIKRAGHLQRIVVLGSGTVEGVVPELEISYPFEQSSRNDPQFDAALNRLLGTI